MQRVFKLTFDRGETDMRTTLPAASHVVHFAAQGDNLCLWYIDRGDATNEEPRHFKIRGTGHAVDGSAVYIDTAFLGPFVFHLFETPTTEKDN